MRAAAISLNIALLFSAMWAIMANYGAFDTEGMVIVSIMITSAVASLLNLAAHSQNGTESEHVRSLKEAIKVAELEKQLKELKEGNK